MLVAGFPAQMYATNCWVLAIGEGSECIVIDPGMPDVSVELAELLSKHRLKPVATLITHGHLDHTFSVVPVCDGYGIPAYIHSEDRNLLSDPSAAITAEFRTMLVGMSFSEPKEVKELKSGQEFELVGLKIKAPALRKILASPDFIPTTESGLIRESMQVTIARPRAARPVNSLYLKLFE